MAGTPIDLSAYKPVAGQPEAAAPISNAFTAIETYTTNAIDPASLKQNAAAGGQVLAWNTSSLAWTPTTIIQAIRQMFIPPTISPTTSGTLVANTANFMPIFFTAPTKVETIRFNVVSGGGTGNVDVGIYFSDNLGADMTRVISSGSTATPATGTAAISVTPQLLTPIATRIFYLAIACSSATPTFSQGALVFVGAFTKATSFPLPATVTSTTSPGASLYLYGSSTT